MSVGCCGPFDADEEDPDSDYDRLAIEAEALRVENRLLMRELAEMRAVIKSVTGVLNNLMEKNEIGGVNCSAVLSTVPAKREDLAMRAALADMLSGWRYIRQSHGDLYGVGWDRAQGKAENALGLQPGQAMPAEWLLTNVEFRPLDAASSRPVAPGTQG